jgi:hypothetical protein
VERDVPRWVLCGLHSHVSVVWTSPGRQPIHWEVLTVLLAGRSVRRYYTESRAGRAMMRDSTDAHGLDVDEEGHGMVAQERLYPGPSRLRSRVEHKYSSTIAIWRRRQDTGRQDRPDLSEPGFEESSVC